MKRAFALGIAVCLAFQAPANVQAAQEVSAPVESAGFFPSDLREIKIPSNLGSLEEVHQGDERLVILVQDAHSIPTAQRSIRNLIDFFQETYGLDQIAVEGARARLDPQIFRSFPDREKLKSVFSQYLESGELTGTTFAAVFNSREADYRAIEDWPLFEEGYGYYLSALAGADETGRVMDAFEKDLERRKEQSYAPQLLLIDRAVRDFRDHSANLMDVLETLASVKAPEPGSELALMLEENAKTDEVRLPLELEVKSISEKVNKYLRSHPSAGSGNITAEFNEKLQAFQTSRLTPEQFAVYLKDLARELNLDVKFSGDFQKRVKKQMKIEDIDGTRFFESFERYAASVKEQLFRDDKERMLEMQTERLYLLDRLKSLELTREQWHQLKNYARRGQFSGPNHIFLEESDVERLMPEPELRRLLAANLLFYENAERRDEVFSEKLEQMLASRSKGKSKAVMLVSGGFHTEGVLSRLKDKGVSYLLLMPKIEALPETVHYKDHMQGLVSWRDYLVPEPGGGVNPYNAFVRATRDRLKQDKRNSESGDFKENPVVIKEWRDQIIRDLAKKGKAAEAARYTRFMDEAVRPGGASDASGSMLQKVDSFVSGLKELEARGQLTEPNILRLLRPSGIAPQLPTNALVHQLIQLDTEVKAPKSSAAQAADQDETFVPKNAQVETGAAGMTMSFAGADLDLDSANLASSAPLESARSELRSQMEDYLRRLDPLFETVRAQGEELDITGITQQILEDTLTAAHKEMPEFRRFSLHHEDFIFTFAEHIRKRGYMLSDYLTASIASIRFIVDAVVTGDDEAAIRKLNELDWKGSQSQAVINVSIHRLAAALQEAKDSGDIDKEKRISSFLEQYLKTRLEEHGPVVAAFTDYLISEYLQKGTAIVFLGRGTEQIQQILELKLGPRAREFEGKIIELLASSEIIRNFPQEELKTYLQKAGVLYQKKTVFVDTGFFARVAKPLARIAAREGVESEYCLFCRVNPNNTLVSRFLGLLSYFYPGGRVAGMGYNEVADYYSGNAEGFAAAAHFFDDMMGKKWEKVWEMSYGQPVTQPTLTPAYHELTRRVVRQWTEDFETRENTGTQRSELRSLEDSEAMRVYRNLIAWRVSSILERGLLRPMTARAMIESGDIPVPQELSEALLPFGLDVRQLLFASSADAKLAPEAYKENDKGALVVIEDIQNPDIFPDASYYEDYDDYIRIKVRGLTQGSPYRSPVSVIAERDFSDVQLELEARGAQVLNERLENSGMVLLSTDKPYEVLEEEAEYRDGPNILGFRQISAEQIEAFFVPEAAYERIVELLPEALRAKVIPVSGKKDLREMDGDAPEGLIAPAWDEAISAFLKSYPWEGRTGRNFMLHGTRFDTPSEIEERVKKRSELRTDSEDSVQAASPSPSLRALDIEKQIFPIIDALATHPDEFQRPDSKEEEAIWKFLQERLLIQEKLYGDSADLSAIAGLFLKSAPGEARFIESRYPGILSNGSTDTIRLTGPVMTVRDLGFGMNRFAYTITVRRDGEDSVFYGKVDNRDIGKKRDSLKESSTYLEMKNQELLQEKFANVPVNERPYAEQFMSVRVGITHAESLPSGAPKTSSRWVQYGHLVAGRDLEKVMKSLRPDRARDSGPVRMLSFSLGEMAGKLFFRTMNENFEGWFFGDMKSANVAQMPFKRPVILNIDSELLLLPPDQFDKEQMPGAKPHAAFAARQELAQIPYKVILEPLGQERIFLPAATGKVSPELVSEAQIANLFLAGFLTPIKKDADWAAKAEAATGLILTPSMREAIQSVWAQADAIDAGTAENFEALDFAALEEGGGWMRRRLDEAAGRSELRDDSSTLAVQNSLDTLARTAGENLIRFYREEDTAGLDLSVARAVTRGAAVNFEGFVDALIRTVESSLGSETESYSKLIQEAMREIAAKIKEADYPQKKGIFVLSPSAQRAELDLTQVNAYKDALSQASGFIDSLYYRFKDNAALREAVREAGIQHFQAVSNFSSIRAPKDVPALPMLTASGEKQEALSKIPFMQIGLWYPDNFQPGDSSAIENKFAVFLQFVFGYVAQNVLTRQDFEFLNRLQELAENNRTSEEVFKAYDEETGAENLQRASERVKYIKSELIKPLTEILGEAAHGLLGGLELGSPGILVGQIAESMKAYEAVRKSA